MLTCKVQKIRAGGKQGTNKMRRIPNAPEGVVGGCRNALWDSGGVQI